jgi:hypothetical protein
MTGQGRLGQALMAIIATLVIVALIWTQVRWG